MDQSPNRIGVDRGNFSDSTKGQNSQTTNGQLIVRSQHVEEQAYVQMEEESTEFQILQGQSQIEMQNRNSANRDFRASNETKMGDASNVLIGTSG